jgi:3-hydroxyacyl-[acyl-carrier-protein] dehydratase
MYTNGQFTTEQESRLRESFKRNSPATVEAIVRFRKEHDAGSVIVIVNGIIERYLKLEPGETLADRPDSTRLGEDLGIDSLTMLEIVMAIEEALDFRIEDAEARSIRTLGDVRRYVDDRVHGRPVTLTVVEAYDRGRLCLVLPQQPPFLFLDRAEIQGETVRATYTFTGEESFFAGHFKDDPLGQAGCLWLLEKNPAAAAAASTPTTAQHVLFVGMDEARFYRRAKPGDQIDMTLKLSRLRAPLAFFDGQVSVRGQLIAKVDGLILGFGDFHPAAFDAGADATAQPELPPLNGASSATIV